MIFDVLLAVSVTVMKTEANYQPQNLMRYPYMKL